MKSMRHLATASAFTVAAVLAASGTAYAQESDEVADSGVIIVTATKRAESVNDVPMSITAASGDDLVAAGIRSADDLGKIVPGFTFTQSAYSTPVYSLRGVGFYNYDIASTPTVTVYQDEAPLPFSAMSRGASFDLERVEVLKGPQGLLFGSNSTGGAVNYIAARPTSSFEGGIDAGYGRFNAWELGGFVSGPLGDNVGVRLAARHEGSGNWQRSTTRNDELGKRNFTQMRLQFDIQAGERLTAKLGVSAFWDKSDVQAAQLIQVNPLVSPAVDAQLFAFPLASGAREADWTASLQPKRDDRQAQAIARFDYEIGDAVTLTSLTSYAHYKQNDRVDPDATNLQIVDTIDRGSIKALFQEIRLSGEFGEGSRWIIGGNYEKNKVLETQTLTSSSGSGFRAFNLFFGAPIPDAIDISSSQKIRNLAAFANVDFAFNDQITAHAGLRYTETRDKFVGCTGNSANGALAPILGIPGNPQCTQFNATGAGAPTFNTLEEDNLSWRIGLDFTPNSDTLVYANVSRGFKIGAFPLIPAALAFQYDPATQEKLTAYEVGFKLSPSRAVQINGAVFYYDYADKQVLGSDNVAPFGTLNRLVNIPKSKIKGAELQLILRPVEGLTLNGGLTYVHTRIGDFTNIDPFGVSRNFEGEAYPNTPKWQGSLAADYEFPVWGNVNGFLGANATMRSKTNGGLGEYAILNIDGYTLLDLRAGVGSDDDRWKLSIWGRNITDKYYWTNAYRIADVSARFAGKPATYGATLSFRY
ncbi:TonB-dependent receptor [Parasphingorhabdus sp.]|uniref:TonB-dependent receptor n=1 Tax=Parasphingorhabdus sp. TaxID=2709688 RepID=UPI003A923367